jgi:hypothetical protein
MSGRRMQRARHRTLPANAFLDEGAATEQQRKADDSGVKLGGPAPRAIRTPTLTSERNPKLTHKPAPPQVTSKRRNGGGSTGESVISRQLFVGMMCETFLGPLMSCGVCHRRPLDVGAGFVTLEPLFDAAKDLVVGRVVCGVCAAEHGPDEGRLAELFEERSIGLPRTYGGSRDIAFVGRPFDVNVEVEGGRR